MLPSDVIDFAMLPAQRFWWETVSLLDVMRLRSNQSDQVVASCKTFLKKVETSSTSCNTICTCCAFYRPKANLFWCFVANDTTPVYGVTPAYQKSEFTCNLKQPDLFSCKTSLIRRWYNAQHSFSTGFEAMLQNKLHVCVAHFTVAYVKMIILQLDLLWTKQEIWVLDLFHVPPNIQREQTETDSFIRLLPVYLPKACWNLATVWHTRGTLYHSCPVPSDGEKQGTLISC